MMRPEVVRILKQLNKQFTITTKSLALTPTRISWAPLLVFCDTDSRHFIRKEEQNNFYNVLVCRGSLSITDYPCTSPVHTFFSSLYYMTQQSKYWCFTVNNPTYDIVYNEKTMDYLIYSNEVGDSGTPHYQGYVAFKKRQRMTGVAKLFPKGHYEVTKGSVEQNQTYIKKQGDWYEFGIPIGPHAGKRTDLAELYEDIHNSMSIKSIAEKHQQHFLKYSRAIERLASYHIAERNHEVRVIVLWGAPGTGKTSGARSLCTTKPYFKNNTKWWDGYDNHEYVIWDEFNPRATTLTEFKQITDSWHPCRVETKGGTVGLMFHTIIFTSNHDPAEWFTFYNEYDKGAFYRRVKDIRHYK